MLTNSPAMVNEDELKSVIARPEIFGSPDETGMVFQKEGPESEVSYWFEAVDELFGPMVSPGGVCMYAPVSRPAIHKRIKEGKMLAFVYQPTTEKASWFGTKRTKRESPYCLVPVSEAKKWRKELEERALDRGIVTIEELEGQVPDWHGQFLKWKDKQGKRGKK